MDARTTSLAYPILATLAAFISILALPWPISVLAMLISSYFFPPAALAEGVFADILYYSGHGIFAGTCIGLFIMVLAFAVRHFVKTRIM